MYFDRKTKYANSNFEDITASRPFPNDPTEITDHVDDYLDTYRNGDVFQVHFSSHTPSWLYLEEFLFSTWNLHWASSIALAPSQYGNASVHSFKVSLTWRTAWYFETNELFNSKYCKMYNLISFL